MYCTEPRYLPHTHSFKHFGIAMLQKRKAKEEKKYHFWQNEVKTDCVKTLSKNGTYALHQRGPLKPCIKYCSSVAWKHQTTHLTRPPAQLTNLLNFHQSSPNRKPQALIQHIPQKHLTSSSLYSNLFICQKINWEQPQFIGLHLHGPVCKAVGLTSPSAVLYLCHYPSNSSCTATADCFYWCSREKCISF